MECKECKKIISNNSKYCENCGISQIENTKVYKTKGMILPIISSTIGFIIFSLLIIPLINNMYAEEGAGIIYAFFHLMPSIFLYPICLAVFIIEIIDYNNRRKNKQINKNKKIAHYVNWIAFLLASASLAYLFLPI